MIEVLTGWVGLVVLLVVVLLCLHIQCSAGCRT